MSKEIIHDLAMRLHEATDLPVNLRERGSAHGPSAWNVAVGDSASDRYYTDDEAIDVLRFALVTLDAMQTACSELAA